MKMAEKTPLENLFAHPYIMLIVAILGIVLLAIPIVLLWQLKMLTGVVFAIVILVICYGLYSMKLLDIQKYPKLGLVIIALTIGGFITGYIGERTGAFLVTPLSEKKTIFTPPALLTEPTAQGFLLANLEVVMVFILLLVLMLWWAKRGS